MELEQEVDAQKLEVMSVPHGSRMTISTVTWFFRDTSLAESGQSTAHSRTTPCVLIGTTTCFEKRFVNILLWQMDLERVQAEVEAKAAAEEQNQDVLLRKIRAQVIPVVSVIALRVCSVVCLILVEYFPAGSISR